MYSDAQYLSERCIISPLHTGVNFANAHMYNKFQAVERVYLSADSLKDAEDIDHYPVDVLNSLEIGNMPPHRLVLKVGCPVVLLRNLNPRHGFCNGTRLICRALSSNVIKVEIASGPKKGLPALIPRIIMSLTASSSPILFNRHQFPVALAFSMTINKTQSQKLSHVGVYLPQPVFSRGRLYVGMSRVRNPSALKFHCGRTSSTTNQTRYTTKNVVFKDVFIS